MQLFIDNFIKQFEEAPQIPVHFVGSIAFYLQEELKTMLQKNGLSAGNILRKPIDGLVEYHLQHTI